ncbi:MAG: hypothetical protein J6Z09_04820 [Lachnospiraceae bacterium]|nr:hypothetical protein [Lachnospiraceae bacterium]
MKIKRIAAPLVMMAAVTFAVACGGKTDTSMIDKIAEEKEADSSVDYDLTVMGKDMVYATVFQMMNDPNEYEGKSFKIAGIYDEMYLKETDTTYHFAVIADALACCSQGLEFVWDDEAKEYPEIGDSVVFKGVFETYKEAGDEAIYCHLVKCS